MGVPGRKGLVIYDRAAAEAQGSSGQPCASRAHHVAGAELPAKTGAGRERLSFSGAKSYACSTGWGAVVSGRGMRRPEEDLRGAQVELSTCQANDGKQLLSAYCILCTVLCFISLYSMRKELLSPLS